MDVIILGEVLFDFISTSNNPLIRNTPVFEKCFGGAPGNVAIGVSSRL